MIDRCSGELATFEYALLPVRTRAIRFRATKERGCRVHLKAASVRVTLRVILRGVWYTLRAVTDVFWVNYVRVVLAAFAGSAMVRAWTKRR